MANKGLQTFAGDEGSNLLAGQCATYYVTSGIEEHEAGVGDFVNVDFFFAVKNISSVQDKDLTGKSLIGDDLAKDGIYGTLVGKRLSVSHGDIIYGCWDKLYLHDKGFIIYMKMKTVK